MKEKRRAIFYSIIGKKGVLYARFFNAIFDKLDLTTILENLLAKVISLDFVYYFIAKSMRLYERLSSPHSKFSNRDAGRQKTISAFTGECL